MNPSPIFEPGQPPAPEHSQAEPAAPHHGFDPSVIYASPAPAVASPEPEPPMAAAALESAAPDQPVAVVRVLSTRGVEYGMMAIALWVAASTMA